MREDIKERIEVMKSGKVPDGYKRTQFGIIPNEWEVYPIKELCEVKNKKYNPKETRENVDCIELENIVQGYGMLKGFCNGAEQESIKNVFDRGDVLYGKLRPYLKKYYLPFKSGVCSSEIWVLGVKSIVIPEYLYYIVQTEKFNTYAKLSCCGSKMPRADWDYIKQVTFAIPEKVEQVKIVSFLSMYDKKLNLINSLHHEKSKYKQWILHRCFMSNEMKCRGWKPVKLSELMKEKNEKKGNRNLEICSVAVKKGVISQEQHMGRSYAAEDTSKYSLVSYGDLIYTKSPTGDFPYGIVKQSLQLQDVAVSPLYGVFKPMSVEVGYIIHSFFQDRCNSYNYLHSIVQKGAKNTINISNKTFLSKRIMFPVNNREVSIVSQMLKGVDEEINLLEKQMEEIKQEKKALIQLLLTGKGRLKVIEEN